MNVLQNRLNQPTTVSISYERIAKFETDLSRSPNPKNPYVMLSIFYRNLRNQLDHTHTSCPLKHGQSLRRKPEICLSTNQPIMCIITHWLQTIHLPTLLTNATDWSLKINLTSTASFVQKNSTLQYTQRQCTALQKSAPAKISMGERNGTCLEYLSRFDRPSSLKFF